MKNYFRSRSKEMTRFALTIFALCIFASSYVLLEPAVAYASGSLLAGSPKVTLRPFNISPGKSDQVTGVNFIPNSNVTITFAGVNNVVATTKANGTGGFVAQFVVAIITPQGLYPVVATDSFGLKGQNILNVAWVPKIGLSTGGKAHIVGVTVSVDGTGFAGSKSVTVYFNNQLIGSTTTNSSGYFLTTFNVPSIPAGTYYVNATDGTSKGAKTFVVSPHLVAFPSSKTTVGSKITLTGTGYSANSLVSFTFGGSPVASTITSKADGSFSVQISIPNVPKGGYQVVGADTHGHSAKGRVGVSN